MNKLNQHIDDIITGKADEKRDGSDSLHELVGQKEPEERVSFCDHCWCVPCVCSKRGNVAVELLLGLGLASLVIAFSIN